MQGIICLRAVEVYYILTQLQVQLAVCSYMHDVCMPELFSLQPALVLGIWDPNMVLLESPNGSSHPGQPRCKFLIMLVSTAKMSDMAVLQYNFILY